MTVVEMLVIAAIICGLIELVLHYFPWGMLLRRRLPRLAAYVLGLLGIMAPLTWLFWRWYAMGIDGWWYLVGLWVVGMVGGAVVLLSYVLDHVVGRVVLATELQELGRAQDENGTVEARL